MTMLAFGVSAYGKPAIKPTCGKRISRFGTTAKTLGPSRCEFDSGTANLRPVDLHWRQARNKVPNITSPPTRPGFSVPRLNQQTHF